MLSAQADGGLRFNIIGADIRQVADAVSVITGRPVVLHRGVIGPISVVGEVAACDEDVVDLFLTAVRRAGWRGGVDQAGRIVLGVDGGGRGVRQLLTRIYSLQVLSSGDMAPLLRSHLSAEGRLAARDDQTLVVVDYASHHCAIAAVLDEIGQSNVLRLKLSSEASLVPR